MKINSTAAEHIKKYCYIVGLLSFLLAFFACSQMIRYQEKEKKAVGTYMAQSTIRRVKAKLENYIMISDFLGNYIIDGSDMDENTFSELAEKIPNEEGVVKAFELAPEGIITESYPMQGNSEALGLDVLGEHERKKDAALAKETGEYTLGGPYQLKQGGTGALLFKPVYRTDDSGESSFWGFVLQVIDWDRFMSDINLKSLSEADFSYKIWSYDRSSGDKVIFAQSQDDMPENSLTIECEIPNNTWYFDIVPSNGWIPVSYWLLAIAASYIFSILVVTIYYQISSKKHREKNTFHCSIYYCLLFIDFLWIHLFTIHHDIFHRDAFAILKDTFLTGSLHMDVAQYNIRDRSFFQPNYLNRSLDIRNRHSTDMYVAK